MSKSLSRVRRALIDGGGDAEPVEMAEGTRSAADAARAIGCALDQIVKSVVLRSAEPGAALLFLTAGGNRVDTDRAADLAGVGLMTADAAFVRAATGFAIGGVAPVGHLTPARAWMDTRLFDFDEVWPAAGTPRHVFRIAPAALQRLASAERADFGRPAAKM